VTGNGFDPEPPSCDNTQDTPFQGENQDRSLSSSLTERLFFLEETPRFLLDARGHFVLANNAFAALGGFRAKDLTGRPVSMLLGSTETIHWRRSLRKLFSFREALAFESEIFCADGLCRTFLVSLSILEDLLPEPLAAATLTDITGRVLEEARLRRRNTQLSTIYAISESLLKHLEPDALLNTACRHLGDLLNTEHVSVCVWDRETQRHVIRAASGILRPFVGMSFSESDGASGEVLRTREPLYIQDYRHSSYFVDLPGTHRIASALVYPLADRERMLGGLFLAFPDVPRFLDAYTLHELYRLLGTVSLAIRNALLREELQARERTYRTLFDLAPLGIVRVTAKEGRILDANDEAARIFGYEDREHFLREFDTLASYANPEDRAFYLKELEEGRNRNIVLEHRDRSGKPLWISLSGRVDREKDELESFFTDVTAAKTLELALQESLAEKETLLREIHHRVKNNLAVVGSLISLQMGSITDPKALEALNQTLSRVRTMGLLHEHLYDRRNLGAVEMGNYLDELVRLILDIAQGHPPRVSVTAASVRMSLHRAVPCALIVNELVTNALKHAWPPSEPGTTPAAKAAAPGTEPRLEIRLAAENGSVRLSVSDNGVGLPPGIDTGQIRSGLGFTLVQGLARQLDGTASFTSDGGFSATVVFPVESPHQAQSSG
jgi:PAS domain S-box-containing protein